MFQCICMSVLVHVPMLMGVEAGGCNWVPSLPLIALHLTF